MNRPIIFVVTFLGTLLLGPVVLAQNVTYEWTDENGVVQQSEHPPEGVEARPVHAKAPPPSPKTTPHADEDMVTMIERCEVARGAEIRACKRKHSDNVEVCAPSSADFSAKLDELPACAELAAELERRNGER